MDHEDKMGIPPRQSKPVGKKKLPINTEKIKLTKEQKVEAAKAITASFIQYREQIEKQRETAKYEDLTQLDTKISEYLGPYLLIGFNLNNEPVELTSFANPLEEAALTDFFKKSFMEKFSRTGFDI